MSFEELGALATVEDTMTEEVEDQFGGVADETQSTGAEESGQEPPKEEPFELGGVTFPHGRKQAAEVFQTVSADLQRAQAQRDQLVEILRRQADATNQPAVPGQDDPYEEHVQAMMEIAALNDPKRFMKEQMRRNAMVSAKIQQQLIEQAVEQRLQEKLAPLVPVIHRDRLTRDPNYADIQDSAEEFVYLTSQGMVPEQAAALIRNVKARGSKQSPVSNNQQRPGTGLASAGRGAAVKTGKQDADALIKQMTGFIFE